MKFFKKNKNIDELERLFNWNQKIFEFINKFSLKSYIRQDKLFNFICKELSGRDFFNVEMIGISMFDKEKKFLNRVFHFSDSNIDIEHVKIPIPNHLIDSFIYNSSQYYRIFNENEILNNNDWWSNINVKHVIWIKIIYQNDCVGFIELFNQLKRKSETKQLSKKGFRWLTLDTIENGNAIINRIFRFISEKTGQSITRLNDAESIKDYVAELINIENNKKSEFFAKIKEHIVSFTSASHLTIWLYDSDNKALMLNYIYGKTSHEPIETVLHLSESWLGLIILNNSDLEYLEKPSETGYFRKSWISTIGDIPVIGATLREEDRRIYGMATVHFKDKEQITDDLLNKVSWYFNKIGPMIDAFRNKTKNIKKQIIETEIYNWLKDPNLDNFYNKLVATGKKIFKDGECSIFMKDRINQNEIILAGSTSKLIANKKGESIYTLDSDDNKFIGITGRVIKKHDYQTLFYRMKDYLDYSGGRCDEFKVEGRVSVIYGRITFNESNIGAIRAVMQNKFHEITADSRLYLIFDKDDEALIKYLSLLGSIVIKLLLYSEEEKDKMQELEHETITPISIVIHEIDDLKLRINDILRYNSKQLAFKINPKSHHEDSKSVWNEQGKRDFDYWLYRLDIAKFEAQLTSNFLRSASVVDIPIEKYNFEKMKLYSVILPTFHHADYLAYTKNKKLGIFKNILSKVKDEKRYVKIDQIMFGQAFLHIVDNAIKYSETPKNKNIDVWFEVQFFGNKKRNFMKLSICNFGIPIPEEERKIIFEKNVSGEYAIQQKLAGKGLGLFVAKTVINNLNGKIGINNRRKDCVEFYLTLPII